MIGSVGPRLSAHVLAVLLTTAPRPPTLVPVSTLSTLAARYAALDAQDLEWLHLLVGDWQVLSDLAFADLVLWLPTTDGDFVAIAQARPSTGATVHYDDVVGSSAPEGQRPQLQRSLDERAAQRSREPRWFGSSPIARWHLVASTTLSRRPASAVARISSDSPSP